MKKSIASFASLLILTLLFCSFQSRASGTPSRYLWTGAVNNNWMTAGNWTWVSGPVIPGGYPGAGGPSASVPSIRHIAMFDNSSNVNCNIGGSYYPSGGFYIGGIEVNGYTGTITQLSGNRLFISDTYFPSGAYDNQYNAVFNFGSGGQFIGSNYNYTAGSQPYQDVISLEVAVELTISGGTFVAPRGMLLMNHCTINAVNFDAATNAGVLKLYPRSGYAVGSATNPYQIDVPNVSFYELQMFGAAWDFQGADFTVLNDVITSGGSLMLINNGTLHVKENLIVNCTDPYGYAASNVGVARCGGTATIVMDGSVPQQMIKTGTENQGPLPSVTLNNSFGFQISGPVGFGELVTFQNGIVTPMTSSPTDRMVFLPSASTTGASDVSYCEGLVKKHIYSGPSNTFIFPVGKNGEYHPIIISAPTGGSGTHGTTNPANYDQFTAEYIDATIPYTNAGPGVFALHDCQYWTLQRNNKPTSNAKVSLTWNSNTCNYSYFASTTNLRVASYNPSSGSSQWENLGASGLTSSQISEATGTPLSQFDAANPTMFTFCQSAVPFVATISSSTNVTCNGGNDGSATVTTTGGVGTLTYSWSTTPVQTTATATGLTAGTYTVTVNSSTGQIATATVTITEPLALSITFSSIPSSVCSTSLPVLLNYATPSGGVYSGGAYVTYNSGSYYFDPQISGVGSFPVNYTFTDGSGCVSTGSFTLTVVTGPVRPLGWEWAKEPDDVGESNGRDIVVDPTSGNVYTVGNFKGTIQFGSTVLTSAGNNDVYIVCHDNAGVVLWAKSYGGTDEDYSLGLSQTGSALTMSGYFYTTTNFDGISLTSNGDRDAFVATVDAANGNIIWANSVGTVNDDEIHAIASDASYTYAGGYFNYGSSPVTVSFGGSVTVTGGGGAMYSGSFVAKYDNTTGNCIWATPSVVDGQKASVIMINTTGEIVVGGYRRSPYVFTPAYYFLESYTSSGALANFNYIETAMTGTGSDYTGLGGIDHDGSGNIYVSGVYSDPSGSGVAILNASSMTTPAYGSPSGTTLTGGNDEVFWAKYDSNLNLPSMPLSAKTIGANNAYFAGSSIAVDNAGNSYITGGFQGVISNLCYSIPSYGYDDVFVMKLDVNGDFVWAQKPDGGYYEAVSDIAIDPSGNVYITGFMFGYNMNFGTTNLVINNGYYGSAYTAKLSSTGSSVYRMAGETAATTSIENSELKVFPNPNNGTFTINTTSEIKDVMIYDMTGKLVFSQMQTTENTIAVDISNETKGLYLIKVVTGNSIQTQRVVNQ